jgi:uncharacterized protein
MNIIVDVDKHSYYLDSNIPQVLLIHPEFGKIIRRYQDCKLSKSEFGNTKKTDGTDTDYYHRLYSFLKDNGYFGNYKNIELNDREYSEDSIRFFIANTEQIVFEVTENCNMKCSYCGFGNLYSNSEERGKRNLNVESAKRMIDYVFKLKQSSLNVNRFKKIAISFYGGEPLLKFSLIKRIIEYCELRKPAFVDLVFSLTTNGTLLDRHIEYLAKKRFYLLISLDGDKANNQHRVFQNGKPSYDIILDNIKKARRKHQSYFKNNVSFISVKHDKNEVTTLFKYFKNNFGKTPIISGLSPIGVKEEKLAEYKRLRKYIDNTEKERLTSYLKKRGIPELPRVQIYESFIKTYSGFVFHKVRQLLSTRKKLNTILTGTCNPFEKKIFLTAGGLVLPCEKISHRYSFGTADSRGVHIDFKYVAKRYNQIYDSLSDYCGSCWNSYSCSQCIYYLNFEAKEFKCDSYLDREDFERRVKSIISAFTRYPKLYYENIRRIKELNIMPEDP